jgi:hypothetical protein
MRRGSIRKLQTLRSAHFSIRYGPVPDYRRLLVRRAVGDVGGGPWVLLDGYVSQGGSYDREAVTFIRGVLIDDHRLPSLIELVRDADYLGNHRIPDAASDYYTFAGEIPWSRRFGTDFRRTNGSSKRSVDKAFLRHASGRWLGIPVEIPVHRCLGELSQHSQPGWRNHGPVAGDMRSIWTGRTRSVLGLLRCSRTSRNALSRIQRWVWLLPLSSALHARRSDSSLSRLHSAGVGLDPLGGKKPSLEGPHATPSRRR